MTACLLGASVAVDVDEIFATSLQDAMHSVAVSPSIPGPLNILDERDVCANQAWRFRAPLPQNCIDMNMGAEGWGCCGRGQIDEMNSAFEHAITFITRTLHDRKDSTTELEIIADNFLALGDECGEVLGLLASSRIRVLRMMENVVSLGVDLLYRTFEVLSCSVCFSDDSRELPEGVVQLARDWRRISRDMVQFRRTITNVDAQFMESPCVPSITRDLQVLVHFHSSSVYFQSIHRTTYDVKILLSAWV